MNSKKHSIATGANASISPKEGGRYSAHDSYFKGKNSSLVKNKLIVQTWREADLDKRKWCYTTKRDNMKNRRSWKEPKW